MRLTHTCSRCRPRWHASPRSQAEVTVSPFPWLSRVALIFPCVLKHAICLFLVPFVFPSYTRVGVEHGETCCISSIRSVSFEEIRVLQACAWLLSRTCAPAQMRSCVKDACFLLPFWPCCDGLCASTVFCVGLVVHCCSVHWTLRIVGRCHFGSGSQQKGSHTFNGSF